MVFLILASSSVGSALMLFLVFIMVARFTQNCSFSHDFDRFPAIRFPFDKDALR